ncbi:hypothetical protein BDA96_07G056700 [Sorghum bicolor]|uniref:Late embryogenesis abundant protein LEA-2 subgroup domain-containing protein n=2 Tax=Sorghum bicolor TaxID=4558 RepID=A0A921QJ14_SORBI|nr:uncharacterized protein LOC8080868 [Sorghum bicolor]EES14611.1 hypothetical protein SORBI_3007G054200 [Sorghum bicolor]KAG0522662.1 hypothetical protein BDA96_07G056700 [Sorghum bicolor]|eukprot:XP_002445116.1 uncharacterized protein LOC8080868 [Sorghum bicolor]
MSSSWSTRGGEPPGGGGGGSHAHGPRPVHEPERSHLDARQTEESPTRSGRAHDHDQLRVREQQPRRTYNFRRRHRSDALQWATAVLCTVLAVVVLVGAVSILVVVLLLQPRAPYVAVPAATARLDTLVYDQLGALDDVQLSLRVEARNGNAHSAATFSRLECRLAFDGAALAVLRADTFRVPARGALPLAYVARAQGAPLGTADSAAMEAALRDGVVPFEVEGEARTRWKVAGVVTINQWTRLACQMRFFWPNGTALPFKCNSKSKFLFF